MFRNRKSRRSVQTQAKRFVCRPSMEAFEKRELLTTVAPFIQGTAFIDSVGNGILNKTDLPLAGATVSLYSGSALLATTTTGSDGGYIFNNGLTVGSTYTLVESAPGYSNTGAQALSSIDPASVTATNTIQVTVVNPNTVVADFTSAVQYGSPATYDHIYYTLNGSTDQEAVPTQLTFTLSGAQNVNTTPFNTFCVDIGDNLNFNTPFPSVIDPQTALPNGGEIGYLYNQYGVVLPTTSSLPTNIQSFPTKDVVAGLQVAIWELEYGSAFALDGYVQDNLGTTATDYANIQTAAAAFIADASGKSEKVAVIDASLTGSLPSKAATAGAQSVLATQSFNFGNKLKGTPSINTQQQPATATVGTSIADKATVTGGNSPTGTVTFNLYSNSAGSGTPLFTDTETLSGGTATSKGYLATTAGTDYWVATYNGDTNNNAVTSSTASEPVVIQPGTTITGIKYLDATGNGLSCTNSPLTGDTPEAGVTIDLYSANPFALVATTVTGANGTYSFSGLPYGSYYVAEVIPSGVIQTGPIQTASGSSSTITNGGFSVSSIGNGCYVYDPSGTSWSFSGQSGITGNGSGFTAANPNAPQGSDVAFLQSQGSFSQSVSGWSAGNYQLSFSAAQRAIYGLNNQNFEVLVDGNVVATFDPKGSAYQTLVTPTFSVSSGSHTITFQGLDSAGGDNTVFLDNVSAYQNMGQALVHTTWDNGYAVNVSATTPASTNNNFSDYTFPSLAGLTNVYYSLTTPAGVTTWGSLGSAVQGDTVTAYFTITSGSAPEMLSLVAYEAPTPYFSSSNAYEQVITSVATGTYGPGTYSQSVTLPNSYYQIDFVGGAPLTQLELDGSKIDYNYQDRLISAGNGGTQTYALSTLSGVVYNDANANDSYGSGDTGIGGVPVYLYNGTGTVRLATTTTASNGTYSFTNLALGTYIVAEFPPSGYTGENPNAGSIGGSASDNSSSNLEQIGSINLNSNTSATSYDFAQFKPVAISGTVYRDKNFNDALDGSDVGIGGVTVYLKSTSGAVIATTTTASNGTYSFTGLNPGVYQIAEAVPGGYVLENGDVGSAGGTCGTGSVTSITLTSGTNGTGYNLAQYDQVSANGYYSTSAGQSQIDNNGGSFLSTSLGNWLAQNCSILCDSGYGNLSGQCNLTVANFYLQIQNRYGTNSWQCSILTAALDEYFGKC